MRSVEAGRGKHCLPAAIAFAVHVGYPIVDLWLLKVRLLGSVCHGSGQGDSSRVVVAQHSLGFVGAAAPEDPRQRGSLVCRCQEDTGSALAGDQPLWLSMVVESTASRKGLDVRRVQQRIDAADKARRSASAQVLD